MTIDWLGLSNFLMFKSRNKIGLDDINISILPESAAVELISEPFDAFDEEFIRGINVFLGTNATGKTTLLKCIYAACECSNEKTTDNITKDLSGYFSASKNTIRDINKKQYRGDSGLVQVRSGEFEYRYRVWDGHTDLTKWVDFNIKAVFIPTSEMLSHSKGLIAMAAKYDGLPFDATQIDILINAQLWETKEIGERNKKILKMIGSVIDGEIIYENDTFYVVKSDGLKVEFSLEADGFKKLGLLWKLIRNGLLESGSVLLWDEPEASINSELIPLLVDILYILKNDGVQIFIATHNYTLAKYIDIKKQNPGDVLFISLYKDKDGTIKTERANNYYELVYNPIEMSEEKLYEAIIEKSLEETE